MISFYQVDNSLKYKRRDASKYHRRIFLEWKFKTGGITFVQALGFEKGYEFGYALGIF